MTVPYLGIDAGLIDQSLLPRVPSKLRNEEKDLRE